MSSGTTTQQEELVVNCSTALHDNDFELHLNTGLNGALQLRLTNAAALTDALAASIRNALHSYNELRLSVECDALDEVLADHVQTMAEGKSLTLDVSEVGRGLTDARLQRMTQGATVVGLNVHSQPSVTSLAPFAGTLTELNAGWGCGIGDAGLAGATQLVKLDARYNDRVTSVAPFAGTLTELDASGRCGIGDAALAQATRLVKLSALANALVTSVAPFAGTLTELDTRGDCGIGDAGLSEATRLVKLRAWSNGRVTSVAPFAGTLTELDASGRCGIGDAGLAQATRLVKLIALENEQISSVAPFAGTLTELDASGPYCGIGDAGLAQATQLVKLNAGFNERVTSVVPFASTLTELDASGRCGIGDAGLAQATRLVKLHARNNNRVTSVAPFAGTLTELDAGGSCGIGDAMLATRLVKLDAWGNVAIHDQPWTLPLEPPWGADHTRHGRNLSDPMHPSPLSTDVDSGSTSSPGPHDGARIEAVGDSSALLFDPLWHDQVTLVSDRDAAAPDDAPPPASCNATAASAHDASTEHTQSPVVEVGARTRRRAVRDGTHTCVTFKIADGMEHADVLSRVFDFYAVHNPDLARHGTARIVANYAGRYGMLADALNFKYLGQLPEHGHLLPSSPGFVRLVGGLVEDAMSDEHVAHELREFFARHDPSRVEYVPRLVMLYAGEHGVLYDSINAAYFDLPPVATDHATIESDTLPCGTQWLSLDIDKGQPRHLCGRGASGFVYKVYSRRLGSFVAEKSVDPWQHLAVQSPQDTATSNTIESSCVLDTLEREAVAMRKLADCPHIVRVLGFKRRPSTNTGVIYMELMEGGSLEDVVKRGGAQWEGRCRPWVHAALLGLKRLHSLELVHRDIKPANILLTADGRAKLSDLGLAKDTVNTADSLCKEGPKGTLQYLAPEVLPEPDMAAVLVDGELTPAASEPLPALTYTAACDVWSLGCTWLRLLTGRQPWDGVIRVNTSLPAMMQAAGFTYAVHRHATARPTIPTWLSQEATDLLERMLRRDPAERIAVDGLLRSAYFTRDGLPDDCETHDAFEARKHDEAAADGDGEVANSGPEGDAD